MHGVEPANEAAGTKCLPSNDYIERLRQVSYPAHWTEVCTWNAEEERSLENQESFPVTQRLKWGKISFKNIIYYIHCIGLSAIPHTVLLQCNPVARINARTTQMASYKHPGSN